MDVPLVVDQVPFNDEAARTGLAHIRQGPVLHLVVLSQGLQVDKTGRAILTLHLVPDVLGMVFLVMPQLLVYLGPPTTCLTHQILLASTEVVVLFKGAV